MFPPRRDNPLRLVGGIDVTEQKIAPRHQQEEAEPRCDYGTQEDLRRYIKRFEEARARYYQALAWTAAAEAGEIPGADVEAAKQDNVLHHTDMTEAGRLLILIGPTDPKAMIDWCLYMEKNFSLLPH